MPAEIHNNMENDEQGNQAKLAALRAAIAEGIASGSEDSDVVFVDLGEYVDKLVAQSTFSD